VGRQAKRGEVKQNKKVENIKGEEGGRREEVSPYFVPDLHGVVMHHARRWTCDG